MNKKMNVPKCPQSFKTTTFHLFPSLPFELRLKIWRLVEEPCNVLIHLTYPNYQDDGTHNPEFIEHLPPNIRRTPFPITLKVCRESRCEVQRRYAPLEGTYFATTGVEVVNWEIDTLVCLETMKRWGVYGIIDPGRPPVDYAPLARLSLDKNITANVTSLTISSCGLRALIFLNGINFEEPFDLGQLMARYLKHFKVLRNLHLTTNERFHSRCKGQLVWGRSRRRFKTVPFRLCNGDEMCDDCVRSTQGLTRIGELDWVIRGWENGPVIRFICLLKEDLSKYPNIEGVEPNVLCYCFEFPPVVDCG